MDRNSVVPVVLCGGQGTRLWPLSREDLPKQFIPLYNNLSLLQNSVIRIGKLLDFNRLFILTNKIQRHLVQDQLKEVSVVDAQIILEPVMRGTGPAITLAAFEIMELNPDSVMLVLSSDNDINQPETFNTILDGAVELGLRNNKFILFGSKPHYPETGYGYIKAGKTLDTTENNIKLKSINRFIEKPSLMEAKSLIRSGCIWNSGIFVFPTKLYLEEMKVHSPEIYFPCLEAFKKGRIFSDKESRYIVRTIGEKDYSECTDLSVDYALLEKTKHNTVVESDIGWSDVGSWKSIYEIRRKNSDGNIFDAKNVIPVNSKNSFVYSRSKKRMIALVDVENLTVVDTDDAIMVLKTEGSQDVKKVVNDLRFDNQVSFLNSALKVYKWGSVKNVHSESYTRVKRIKVKPQKGFSASGSRKNKHFIVLKGSFSFTNGNNTCEKITRKGSVNVLPNQSYHFQNLSKDSPAELLKIEF